MHRRHEKSGHQQPLPTDFQKLQVEPKLCINLWLLTDHYNQVIQNTPVGQEIVLILMSK
jgi:hypothetical protein